MIWMFIFYGAIAAVLSAILFFPIHYLANKFNWLDIPNDRKIHKKPIPRLGGVMIFVAFIAIYYLAQHTNQMLGFIRPKTFSEVGFIFCGTAAFLLGILDDLIGLKALQKLTIQLAIGFGVAMSGLAIHSINVLGYQIEFGVLSYLITALWVVALLNAVNLIDGMDGLAAGIMMIALGFTFVVSIIEGAYFVTLISGILFGGLLGFYIFNFPPAKIFMGDSGSYFIGCMYAMIAMMGMKKTSMAIMMAIPFVLLLLPIADIIYITFRRIKKKESIFKADKNHIHHRLLNIGLSVRQIISLTYLVCLSFGLIGILIALTGGQYGLIFFFLIMCLAMAGFWVIRILEKR